jgi:hypothetical protein
MVAVVDALRADYPVEAICAELAISSQHYYVAKARAADLRWRRLLAGERQERRTTPLQSHQVPASA